MSTAVESNPQLMRLAGDNLAHYNAYINATIPRNVANQLLFISEASIKTHLQHIYTKLDIHSARELMISNLDHLAGNDVQ